MISELVSVFQWVSIKQDTRAKIASMLNLTKSGQAEVVNGILITDGYTLQDLAGITNEKMERFTHIGDGSIITNLNKLIEIIETREPVEIKPIVVETPISGPVAVIKEKKKAKKLDTAKKLPNKKSYYKSKK